MTSDPEEIAQLNAKAMWAQDKASRALGMKIEKIAPGHAVLSMSVGINMVNGHGLCHGGYIFTLADSAFALACNSCVKRQVGAALRGHVPVARAAWHAPCRRCAGAPAG